MLSLLHRPRLALNKPSALIWPLWAEGSAFVRLRAKCTHVTGATDSASRTHYVRICPSTAPPRASISHWTLLPQLSPSLVPLPPPLPWPWGASSSKQFVSVCVFFCNKTHHLGSLGQQKQQKFIISQFWRLEAQSQGVGNVCSS